MNNEDQILAILLSIRADIADLKERQASMEADITSLKELRDVFVKTAGKIKQGKFEHKAPESDPDTFPDFNLSDKTDPSPWPTM